MIALAVMAGVLLSLVFATPPASAEVRIHNDPGGEVSSYLRRFGQVRNSGEKVVIDGVCNSACTLVLATVPRDHICVTSRAVLGFHAASLYDDASRQLVPTRSGTRLVMAMYPQAVRHWIERHGGLTPRLIHLSGRELAAMYRPCQ
jgi:hypothetical protein